MTTIVIDDISDGLLAQFKEFASLKGIRFAEYIKKPIQLSANSTSLPFAENVSEKKKLTPLDRQYFKGAWMSEDFDAYLGDEFWLGDDA